MAELYHRRFVSLLRVSFVAAALTAAPFALAAVPERGKVSPDDPSFANSPSNCYPGSADFYWLATMASAILRRAVSITSGSSV